MQRPINRDFLWHILSFISILFFIGSGSDAQTFNPSADSYIYDANPSANYGTSVDLIVKRGNTSNFRKAFVKFDLSGSGISSITSAVVRLCTTSSLAIGMNIYETSDGWTETGITWNNAPAEGLLIASTSIAAAPGYYDWDITSYVQSQLAGSDPLISMVIYSATVSTGTIIFSSREAYVNRPELVITVNPTPPAPPTNLIASATSSSQINLTWTDNASNETGYKVERKSGAGAFAEIALLNQGSAFYNDMGLPANTLYTYRVYAYNDSGNSGYSNESSANTYNTGGVTYYVDALDGNDLNDGLTPASAWKTLAKVSAITFAPGSRILFKAGGSWTGRLYPKGSGEAGNPIVIDSYGAGPKPLIDGAGMTGTGVVYLYNQQYWEINNLEIINDAASGGDRRGVRIEAKNYGTANHIYLKNLSIHNIKGLVGQGRPEKRTGGIGFAIVSVSTQETHFNDILIEDCQIYSCENQGIITECVSGDGFDPYSAEWNAMKITNAAIRNNVIHDISKNAMIIRLFENGVVEHNVCFNTANGISGNTIFSASCSGTVFQYNEGYDNNSPDADGSMYDADLRSPNTYWQYSYSHDNAHGLFWTCTVEADTNVVCRYNISQNDQGIIFCINYPVTSVSVYNNTVYIPADLSPVIISERNNGGAGSRIYSFKNNLIYNLSSSASYDFTSGYNRTIDYNCFWGVHPPGEPADLHKVTGNPQLVGPGSGGSGINSVDGYMLQTGSSCINKGTAISGNGGKDYWGNHLYNGLPDIGAHEYPVKSSNGGNWSSPATWNPSGVPTSTSIINLLSGVVMVDVNNAVCNALTVKSGAILRISDSKDLTVYGTHSSAGTESVSIENGAILDNTGTLALKNNLENKNTSPNSLGTGTIEISGGTSQMIGGRNIIRNLYVNNPAGLMLEGDTKVDGTLTLISGNITPGDNNLHLGPLAIIEGAPSEQAMIVVTGTGQLRKEFPSGFTGSFTFPVGDATETTEFSPVTVNYSGGIFEPDNYTGVNLVNSKHPEDPNTGNWLNRYWNITGNETTAFTFNALFHYLPADVHGVESRIGCIKLLPAPEIFYGPADTLLHTLTATGVSQYGTFIGSKTAPEIYTVTGSGYFCAGGTGLTIGLGGSETDASYQLMKNGNPLGDPVPGTGYGLTWSNQFSGIYTIDATNSAGTRAMNDSALVTEKPYPSEAGLISGPATVTQGQTDVHYTVPVIANATGYFWTLPSGAAITSGSNTESILVSFSATATSGIISVYGTNDCGNGTVSPDFSITVNPSIPEQLAVEGTVTGSEAKCYNATQTITIAGNNSTFLVEAGGDATMVAGQKIVFLPETMVQQGGHLWAYITTTSDYCGARGSSMVNSETKELEKISYEPGQDFRVYPNPTEGALTLEFSGIEKAMQTCIEIYRMTGELISKVDVIGVGHHSFSLAGEPAGIYFLRMVDKGKTGTIRIIKY